MADQPNNIFNSEQPVSQPPTQEAAPAPEGVKQPEAVQQPSDPYVDLLKTITSQDGRQKYATVSDAISSIPHAQTHISTLEQELQAERAKAQELQEQLEKAAKMEDVLSQVAQNNTSESPSVEINEQQVMGLVEQFINNKEQQTSALHNQKEVASQLSQKFGEKAEEAYNQKAQELGIDVSFLNDMAARSPKAVLSYFGGAVQSAPQKTPGSSINTASLDASSQPRATANPLLTGNTSDMQAEWNRIAEKVLKS